MKDSNHCKINRAFDEYRAQLQTELQTAMDNLNLSLSKVARDLSEAIDDETAGPAKPMKRRFRVPVYIRTPRIESGYRWCWAESIDEAEKILRRGNYDEKIVHEEVDHESEETTLDRNSIEEVADTDGPKSWA